MSGRQRWGNVRRTLGRRALLVFGLSAMAVTQPLLDLFGRNGDFFVAGHYSRSQIVMFALVIALLPPLAATAFIAIATGIGRRAGDVAFWLVAVAFTGAFSFGLLRNLGFDSVPAVLWHAAIITLAVSVALWRTRALRLFVFYLAAANVLFVGLFYFSSDVEPLLFPQRVSEIGTVPALEAPIVFIVFDELPVATIMREDGTMNADRYPGFAELADVSTWYRNASTPYELTTQAIPALLTGTAGDPDLVASHQRFPVNLFTLVGGSVPVERVEMITDMCPPRVCDIAAPDPLAQALADGLVVYGHRLLPGSLRDHLPAIDSSWGKFGLAIGNDDATQDEGRDAARNSQSVRARSTLRAQIERIDGEPALHYTHVLLPHEPWVLSPRGMADSADPDARPQTWGQLTLSSPDSPGYEVGRRFFYQMHSLQVGAADAAIGELLTRLRSLPNWRDVLLVVTADHGIGFTSGAVARLAVTADNRDEVLRVPLFIKYPGQTSSELSDRSVSSMDVVPTIVDALDIELGDGVTFDGRSLLDPSAADTNVEVLPSVAPLLALAAERNAWFPHGDDWEGLAAVGEHGALVGTAVSDHRVGSATPYTAAVDGLADLADLPTAGGRLPLSLSGTVEVLGEDQPAELLVAVNGRLAGVVGTWGTGDDELPFIGHVNEDAWRDGANELALYAVEERSSGPNDIMLRPIPLD